MARNHENLLDKRKCSYKKRVKLYYLRHQCGRCRDVMWKQCALHLPNLSYARGNVTNSVFFSHSDRGFFGWKWLFVWRIWVLCLPVYHSSISKWLLILPSSLPRWNQFYRISHIKQQQQQRRTTKVTSTTKIWAFRWFPRSTCKCKCLRIICAIFKGNCLT